MTRETPNVRSTGWRRAIEPTETRAARRGGRPALDAPPSAVLASRSVLGTNGFMFAAVLGVACSGRRVAFEASPSGALTTRSTHGREGAWRRSS